MPLPEAVSNRLIGALFVERGLVSQSQLLVALELQQETGQQLGQILVERFGVERSDLAKVVAEHWARLGEAEDKANTRANESWRQLGDILVERGFVTREQLVQALERQRQTGERLGEALIGQGVLSKFELAGSLAEQASTVGDVDEAQAEPAQVVPLPRMDLVVNPATAEQLQHEPEVALEADAEAAPDTEAAPGSTTEVEPQPLLERAEPEPPAEIEEDEDLGWPQSVRAIPGRPTVTLVPEPTASEDAQPVEGKHEEHGGDRPQDEEHVVAAYVVFASTPRGYRLVVVDDGTVPDIGERIELPELGELVVLRRGVSPLPRDERTCIFLEPPVPAAHAG